MNHQPEEPTDSPGAETASDQADSSRVQQPLTSVRIPATAVTELRSVLLQDDGRERVAFGACTQSADTALLQQVFTVPDSDHAQITPGTCRPTTAVERQYLSHVTRYGRHPFVVHSHPMATEASFSAADDRMIEAYRQWLQPLFPDRHLLFAVLTETDLLAAIIPADANTYTALPVDILGAWRLTPSLRSPDPQETVTDVSWQRFDRSIRALGLDGQLALKNAHVAVVGLGGVGSHVAVDLARLGVGELTLVDPDEVERSNLPRLRGARPGDVGQPKVRVTQEACTVGNPDVTTTVISTPAQEAADHLQQADVLVGCVDRVTARYWLNEFAIRHLLPYIDVGVRIDVDDTDGIEAETALLQTVIPGVTGCFDCLERGDPEQARIEQADETDLQADLERGYISGADLTPAPAVIDLNAEASAKAVRLVKQLITGADAPPSLLQYDATTQDLTAMETTPRSGCLTCGTDGILALGDYSFDPALTDTEPPDSGESDTNTVPGLPSSVAQCFQRLWD